MVFCPKTFFIKQKFGQKLSSHDHLILFSVIVLCESWIVSVFKMVCDSKEIWLLFLAAWVTMERLQWWWGLHVHVVRCLCVNVVEESLCFLLFMTSSFIFTVARSEGRMWPSNILPLTLNSLPSINIIRLLIDLFWWDPLKRERSRFWVFSPNMKKYWLTFFWCGGP